MILTIPAAHGSMTLRMGLVAFLKGPLTRQLRLHRDPVDPLERLHRVLHRRDLMRGARLKRALHESLEELCELSPVEIELDDDDLAAFLRSGFRLKPRSQPLNAA